MRTRRGGRGAVCGPGDNRAVGRAVTSRQLEAVRAHVETGSMKAAAAELGIAVPTLRGRLVATRRRLGVETTMQAVYVLAATGELAADVGLHPVLHPIGVEPGEQDGRISCSVESAATG